MPPFLEAVESSFGTRDLYEALGIEKTAGSKVIRSAYRRLSLQVHPDKVAPEEVEQATQKFQVLGKIYAILGDSDKRAIYDEDGTVDEDDDPIFKKDFDWMEYWSLLFNKVTIEDMVAFEKTYRGSQEELDSLKSIYIESEGDMNTVLDSVMCSTIKDEPRFRELIEGWIAEGSVPAFEKFTKEPKAKRRARKRKWEAEAREAEKEAKKRAKDDDSEASLTAMIKARQRSRNEEIGSLFDSLEEKYCPKKSKKTTSSKKKGSSSSKSNGSRGKKK